MPGSRNSVPSLTGSGAAMQDGMPAVPVSKYIKHVVFIVQENRSFENIFAGFKGADAPLYGYEKSNNKVTKINLTQIDWNAPTIYHGVEWTFKAYDKGKMDQFNIVPFDKPPNDPSGHASYAYLKHSLIQPYWDMANYYTLVDHMFPTAWGGSFSAHLD